MLNLLKENFVIHCFPTHFDELDFKVACSDTHFTQNNIITTCLSHKCNLNDKSLCKHLMNNFSMDTTLNEKYLSAHTIKKKLKEN